MYEVEGSNFPLRHLLETAEATVIKVFTTLSRVLLKRFFKKKRSGAGLMQIIRTKTCSAFFLSNETLRNQRPNMSKLEFKTF